MTNTISVPFGDRTLAMTPGPPVGDGPFLVWTGCNVYLRWLRGDKSFDTDDKLPVSGRDGYKAHRAIDAAPLHVAAALQVKIGEVDGERYIALQSLNSSWLVQISSNDHCAWKSPGEIAALPGKYIDPWALTAELKRLESENARLAAKCEKFRAGKVDPQTILAAWQRAFDAACKTLEEKS